MITNLTRNVFNICFFLLYANEFQVKVIITIFLTTLIIIQNLHLNLSLNKQLAVSAEAAILLEIFNYFNKFKIRIDPRFFFTNCLVRL